MGKFRLKIEKLAELHLKKHIKSGNQAAIKKINIILEELQETPFQGVGKPEALKHELTGFWSREINSKDRIIYKVDQDIVMVYVFSAKGHYFDK
jgi:toxin YoeB